MNQRFGPPPRGGFGNTLFPFVLGGVVGSLITSNRRPYYYPYPMYYYPYPYYNNYYRN